MTREPKEKFHAHVDRLEASDREALAELWARHRERLLKHVERKLDRVPVMRRVIDSADVVQSVYFEALRNLPHYLARSGRVEPSVWLGGLARRRLGSYFELYLAQKRCLRGQQTIPDDAGDFLVDDEPEPAESEAAREPVSIIEELLLELSPLDREALRLARIEERPLREVAEIFGISEDAAAQRVSRARKRLRTLIDGRSLCVI